MHIKNIQEFINSNPIDKLSKQQAEEIYNKVVDDLNYHNWLYYVKSSPIISDYEYDLLFSYLKKLEEKFNFSRLDSPTQKLTFQIQDELKKSKHTYPLLSLENTYSVKEAEEKLDKIIKDYNINEFYVEPKYDGLSVELVYENGFFKQAITRWDGFIGEDVTENVKTIRTLPLKIDYKWVLHIRWEVVIKKSEFKKINEEREKKWLELYSNPRNLASWSLRQLNSKITAERNLDVITYEILNIKDLNIAFHHKALDFLEQQWFFVYDFKVIFEKYKIENNLFKTRKSLWKNEVLEVIKSEKIKNLLENEDIEFDWLVIKVDNVKYWDLIGYTSHHPKWAFAFKYPAKQISSKILDVQLSVGRTGIITPVAILQPVKIDNVVVKRATLHNFDFIKEKDIHINDYVWVQRSWEVIPYILWVIKERRQPQKIKDKKQYVEDLAKSLDIDYENSYLKYLLKYDFLIEKAVKDWLIEILLPTYCPVCGWDTFKASWEVALKCINVACPAQVKEKISYFVSKNWLDISWLSEKTIETLLNAKLISDYADIFKLKEKRHLLVSLPGFWEKKVDNILQSIESKRQVYLNVLLSALGIEFVWKKTALLISDNLPKEYLKNFYDGKYIDFKKFIDFIVSSEWEEFLYSVNWIWPKVVESIKKFFNENHNKKVISKLLNEIKVLYSIREWKFSWKEFVITWSFPNVSREEIWQWIEDNGGVFSNQVTSNTTLLLVWEKPWKSKLDKAKKLNIPTYPLDKFLKEHWFNLPTLF